MTKGPLGYVFQCHEVVWISVEDVFVVIRGCLEQPRVKSTSQRKVVKEVYSVRELRKSSSETY